MPLPAFDCAVQLLTAEAIPALIPVLPFKVTVQRVIVEFCPVPIPPALFDRAVKFREEHTSETDSYDEFKQIMDGRPGFVVSPRAQCAYDWAWRPGRTVPRSSRTRS